MRRLLLVLAAVCACSHPPAPSVDIAAARAGGAVQGFAWER